MASKSCTQRPRPVRGRHDVLDAHDSHQLRWSLGVSACLLTQAVRLLAPDYRDHPVLACTSALGRTRQSGDEHEDRDQDRRADEDDEAGKELGTGEQLEHRDDEIGGHERGKGPPEPPRQVAAPIRQARPRSWLPRSGR